LEPECERVNTVRRDFTATILTNDPAQQATITPDAYYFLDLSLESVRTGGEPSGLAECYRDCFGFITNADGSHVLSLDNADHDGKPVNIDVEASAHYLNVLLRAAKWANEYPTYGGSIRTQDRCNREHGHDLRASLEIFDGCMLSHYEQLNLQIEQTEHDETNESPEDLQLIKAKQSVVRAAEKARKRAAQIQQIKDVANEGLGLCDPTYGKIRAHRMLLGKGSTGKKIDRACSDLRAAYSTFIETMKTIQ